MSRSPGASFDPFCATGRQVFDWLRKHNPAAFAKLVAVRGDCEEEGLGVDAENRRILVDRVSVLFHSAASVRFTDPIKKAVNQNTRSTRDVVQLAREMRQLKALVHVSTAYAFTDHNPIKECVFETQHDWRDVIKYASLPDAQALDTLGPKCVAETESSVPARSSCAHQISPPASPVADS